MKPLTSRTEYVENVEYRLFDKDGKAKPMFQTWGWVSKLIKRGWLSPLHKKIPGLFGFWSDSFVVANLVTSTGKAAVASRINGSGAEAAFVSIGIGTGTTAASVSDTALETGKAADGTGDSGVHALASGSVTASRVTTSVTNDTAQLLGTVTFTASMAVTESGVFNANTAGVMLARQVFSAVNVVSTDTLQLTWKVQAS